MSTDLARRSIHAVAWNSLANLARIAILFVRSVFLARLLAIDIFGIYGFANAIIVLSVVFIDFGLDSAFIHRARETENEETAAAVFLTLKLIVGALWVTVLVVVALVVADGLTRTALLVMTATYGLGQLTDAPQAILVRRIVHRRLALRDFVDAVVTTALALWLAWRGAGIWALLAVDIAGTALSLFFLYGYRPVWRPRLAWDRAIVRYYLRFGVRTFAARLLGQSLDRVDDLWTGAYLGDTALGLYSRAYTFAQYPRRILAQPVYSVAGGTYAELKGDRHRLSQAFFRTNALLVRSGFLLGGLLALVAPEFIRLLLTPKWLPMLDIFRLMLIYTLLNPIKFTVAQLFTAVGVPEKIVQARLVQIAVLVLGLFTLGPALGTVGVAHAVNAMLVVGTALLLWQARAYVDYSLRALFGWPTVALAVGLGLARLALLVPGVLGSDWRTGIVKTVIFVTLYGAILLAAERTLLQTARRLVQAARVRPNPPPS